MSCGAAYYKTCDINAFTGNYNLEKCVVVYIVLTTFSMPATVESPTPSHRDSAFFEGDHYSVMDRLRPSLESEHVRSSSLDGADTNSSTLLAPTLKRTGSLRRPKTDSNLVYGNIGEQTQLLLRKMAVLEQKLTSMESQLKHEQIERLNLEAKVVKLEEENEKLKTSKIKAANQLQEFSEKFFAAADAPICKASPCVSPFLSVLDLRSSSRSRADSISSGSSSSQSRFSAVSL